MGEALADVERGRRIYNYRCYFCHGYNGDANTLAASFLDPPPPAFIRADPEKLTRARMLEVVRHGRPGTAMMGFGTVLDDDEIAAVVDFVRLNFMLERRDNTRYHTEENGWPNHERYRVAYPFALGEITLDTPWEKLSEEQRVGKRLYLESCVICHDRGKVEHEGAHWQARPLSFPRNGYSHRQGERPVADSFSAASVYALHDKAPEFDDLTPSERRGERLYHENCAFCHAPDGTGKHWIGRYLQPHPRDFTRAGDLAALSDQALMARIGEGVAGSAMPAWKHVLSESQIRDVIAYLRRAFLPAGNAGSLGVIGLEKDIQSATAANAARK